MIAFVVVSRLACFQAKRQGINPDIVFNFLFLVLIMGIAGARIFYITENLGYYLKNPWEIIMLQHGGLSWFGGLFSGFIFSLLYLKKNKLSPYRIFDLIIPFLALGQAIGRIGCLFNGCCFGRISEKFGLYFESQGLMLIPTQIYSALLLTLVFIILRLLQNRPHRDGQIFFTYLLLYSVKRFFIEFWRADNPVIFFGLTLFQVLSAIIFSFAALWFLLNKTRKNNISQPNADI